MDYSCKALEFIAIHSNTDPVLQAQYAAPESGVNAANIGWINFGINFSLLNGQIPTRIVNQLNNGLQVSMNVSATVVGSTDPANPIGLVSNPAPIYASAPFGNTAYTGLGGYPTLQLTGANPEGTPVTVTLQISDIVVSDCCGKVIPNFIFYAADAETTNLVGDSEAEIWSVQTTCGTWTLVEQMSSVSGGFTGPTVVGLNTSSFVEIGTTTQPNDTSAYVVATQSPQTVTAMVKADGGNQGFAFGIQPILNECLPVVDCALKVNKTNVANHVSIYAENPQLFHYDDLGCPIAVIYQGQFYQFCQGPIGIETAQAEYQWTIDSVVVSNVVNSCTAKEDVFLLVVQNCNGEIDFYTVIFTNYK